MQDRTIDSIPLVKYALLPGVIRAMGDEMTIDLDDGSTHTFIFYESFFVFKEGDRIKFGVTAEEGFVIAYDVWPEDHIVSI